MRNAGRGIARLNVAALYAAVVAERHRRGLHSLNTVAEELGLNPATVHRMRRGATPDAHNLCAILAWLGEEHWWITRQEPHPPLRKGEP